MFLVRRQLGVCRRRKVRGVVGSHGATRPDPLRLPGQLGHDNHIHQVRGADANDFFRVNCTASDGAHYENTYAGLVPVTPTPHESLPHNSLTRPRPGRRRPGRVHHCGGRHCRHPASHPHRQIGARVTGSPAGTQRSSACRRPPVDLAAPETVRIHDAVRRRPCQHSDLQLPHARLQGSTRRPLHADVLPGDGETRPEATRQRGAAVHRFGFPQLRARSLPGVSGARAQILFPVSRRVVAQVSRQSRGYG